MIERLHLSVDEGARGSQGLTIGQDETTKRAAVRLCLCSIVNEAVTLLTIIIPVAGGA